MYSAILYFSSVMHEERKLSLFLYNQHETEQESNSGKCSGNYSFIFSLKLLLFLIPMSYMVSSVI